MDGTAFDFPSHGGKGHKFSSVPKLYSQVSFISFIHCDISVVLRFVPSQELLYDGREGLPRLNFVSRSHGGENRGFDHGSEMEHLHP